MTYVNANKALLFIFISLLTVNCFSQINFEKGYFINDSNQKIECLIKNVDWKNNPTDFDYKLSENSDKITATIKTVKAFGVYNASKYDRHTVNMDRSSNVITNLSKVRNAVFKEEELFLKVLIEGKANLYSFEDGNLIRYFYSKDDTKIEQLIFKEYYNIDNKINKNNRYKQQLWNDLKCSTFKMSKVERLDYLKNDLINFFIAYNECNDEDFTNYEEKQKKDLFNLSIRPGLNYSSLSIQNTRLASKNIDFDREQTFRLGIEAELIMPFNKNKWAVIIEPTYQFFKSEKTTTSLNGKVDYKSIELPIGIRHYLFLNDNIGSKIFVNATIVLDIAGNSTIELDNQDLNIRSRENFAFGLGYKYNDKYSLELRYFTNREILNNNNFNWLSYYSTLSVIFGYSIF